MRQSYYATVAIPEPYFLTLRTHMKLVLHHVTTSSYLGANPEPAVILSRSSSRYLEHAQWGCVLCPSSDAEPKAGIAPVNINVMDLFIFTVDIHVCVCVCTCVGVLIRGGWARAVLAVMLHI